MTLWRNPSDQLVRVYLIPVSQLSHLDITNIKVDSQVRCHLKDISKLNTNVQKYFINSSLLNVSIFISVIINVTIVLQTKLYGFTHILYKFPNENNIFWPIVPALRYPSSVNSGTIQILGDVFCSHEYYS